MGVSGKREGYGGLPYHLLPPLRGVVSEEDGEGAGVVSHRLAQVAPSYDGVEADALVLASDDGDMVVAAA